MALADLDWISAILRALVYASSIAVAGAVLFYASVKGAAKVEGTVRRQFTIGALSLLVVEAMRYAQFQLSVADGDAALAFDPTMRWLAFETAIGQSALVRVIAALGLCAFGLRFLPLSVAAALAIIGSFAVEGHTVSAEGSRLLMAALIIVHLSVVHWWLGSLLPLRAATRLQNSDTVQIVHSFGHLAVLLVAVLVAAGALLLGVLTDWTVDLSQPYQLAFAIKLALFAIILGIAARNKLTWTPMLSHAPAAGVTGLRRSLTIEIGVCLLLLVAAAFTTAFSPSR